MRAPEFWSAERSAPALTALLSPLAAAYGLAGRLRRALATAYRPAVPVICVGNLVAGGAGKTPVALSLAARLAAQGRSVHILTRGYGGRAAGPLRVDAERHTAAEVGDEALLLARAAPTWVARERAAAARAAVEAGAELLLLDDGFQNPSIAKDLSLLVVDGAYGFGNGRVMPAGPLRESVTEGMARADAVVLMGEDRQGLSSRLATQRPLLPARLVPAPDGAAFAGRKVLAFAGIGRPQKFFDSLAELGADIAETRTFPDHHPYSAAEIESLAARAKELNVALVTTEKDAVRLPPARRGEIETLPVAVAWDDSAALDDLLAGMTTASRNV